MPPLAVGRFRARLGRDHPKPRAGDLLERDLNGPDPRGRALDSQSPPIAPTAIEIPRFGVVASSFIGYYELLGRLDIHRGRFVSFALALPRLPARRRPGLPGSWGTLPVHAPLWTPVGPSCQTIGLSPYWDRPSLAAGGAHNDNAQRPALLRAQ